MPRPLASVLNMLHARDPGCKPEQHRQDPRCESACAT